MSAFINSILIEPVVRQARRFSYPAADWSPATHLSHAGDDARDRQRINQDIVRRRPENQIQSIVEAPPDVNRSYWSSIDFMPRDLRYGLDLQDVEQNHGFDLPRVSSPEGINEYPQSGSGEVPSPLNHGLPEPFDRLPSLDQESDITRNPPFHVPQRLRGQSARTSMQSRGSISNGDLPSEDQGLSQSRQGSVTSLNMSGALPSDDGMRPLREKIQLIRDMALSSEEKARRMHSLMVADYEAFKTSTNPVGESSKRNSDNLTVGINLSPIARIDEDNYRSLTPISTASTADTKDTAIVVSTDDLKPTYQPRPSKAETRSSPDVEVHSVNETGEQEEEEPSLGCTHYMRNVKIQCGDCRRWYTCRHCHDDSENHPLNRETIKNMLCMLCGHPQRAGEYCEECGEPAATYYCPVCQLWENDPNTKIYHCVDCGICRRGEGLGKDFVHCKKCNVCIAIAWIGTHRCVEHATECDCPICNDWMFTSSAAVVAMRCGHYIHRKCYEDYMRTSYKCPICNRSAINMELQWRKLDQAIDAQPMPSQFSDTKAWINCNDCTARTCTKYHWLGNKCTACDSYNTNYIKLVNNPTDHELEAISSSRAVRAAQAADHGTTDSDEDPNTQTSLPERRATQVEAVTDGLQIQHDVTVRSAESLAVPREVRPSTPSLGPSHQVLPQSPTNTSSTRVELTSSPSVPSPSRHENNSGEISTEILARGGDGEDDEEEEDDVGFWGESISPSTWSMPMGISPMSGWTSPSFFATRMEARNGEANRNEAAEDDVDDDGEWSTDGSEEDGTVELDEDVDVEDIELFGHR